MQLVKDIAHYVIKLDFKFHQLYIVWMSDDEIDEVLVNDDFKIVAFNTEADLLKYARMHLGELCVDSTDYSIYKLQQWTIDPYLKFDYNEFLNFWNLCTDVAESIKSKFAGDIKDEITDIIYDKLFNASDVFIADEPNPTFNILEIEELRKVIQNGLDLLLNNLVIIENEKILP